MMNKVIDRRTALSTLLLSATAVALSACNAPPSRGPFPELTYTHLADINLDVATIEIVEAYQSPGTEPNVEHLFPVTPAQSARRWAEDRLVAVGIDGFARFIILDASAIESRNVAPPAGSSLEGAQDRYDMRIAVRIEIVKANGSRRSFVAAEATLVDHVEPDTTLNERERAWFRDVETLMRALNTQLEATIAQSFGPYLR
jgi:hypothetical protein